jgi:uncharacterized membrane protein HdeD (DUF308 family)
MVAPGAGALAIVWILGIYAVIFGALLLAFALRLRGLRRAAEEYRPSLDVTALS